MACGTNRVLGHPASEEAVTRTLESTAVAATHWSTRTLAQELGLSQRAVVRIWHAFGLQPHRRENFKLSTDSFFVEKVRDIVGLYMNPPDHAIVLDSLMKAILAPNSVSVIPKALGPVPPGR